MLKPFALLFILTSFVSVSFSQPPDVSGLEKEADTLLNHRDFNGAIKVYTKIIETTTLTEKSNYKSLYKRAVCYYSAGDLENALADISKYIPEFPETYQARILRALIYRQLSDVENQLQDLNKAIELNAMNPELFRWRSILLVDMGKFAEAKKDLIYFKNFQDDAELETSLGLTYYNLHIPDSAMLSLNKAIELDPTHQTIYLYAGSFLMEESKYDEAINYLNLALRLDPHNRSALYYKGVALLELKRTDEGCRLLRKSFQEGEDEAMEYLKEFCYEVGKR